MYVPTSPLLSVSKVESDMLGTNDGRKFVYMASGLCGNPALSGASGAVLRVNEELSLTCIGGKEGRGLPDGSSGESKVEADARR